LTGVGVTEPGFVVVVVFVGIGDDVITGVVETGVVVETVSVETIDSGEVVVLEDLFENQTTPRATIKRAHRTLAKILKCIFMLL
jgi:hypothetical protein